MPEKLETGIIYYRAKSEAIGSVVVGLILLGLAVLVHIRDGVAGIPFSNDFEMLATYLALPLGVVLVLANIRHATRRGPTFAAGRDGIMVLFPTGRHISVNWAEIAGFRALWRQGRWYLGVTLQDPYRTLPEFRSNAPDLLRSFGPKSAHLKIDGRMLDDYAEQVVADLEEMRQVNSWRT